MRLLRWGSSIVSTTTAATSRDPATVDLWLTDRSRYLTGLQHCSYRRFLEYHAGTNGYGFRRKSEAMPLVTGTHVHEALARVLSFSPGVINRGVVRTIIDETCAQYDELLRARGFQDLEEGSDPDYVRREQMALVGGLVWGWYRVAYDEFRRKNEIIRVEVEETYVAGCRCGLGDGVGEPEDHAARGCAKTGGVVIMSRPDVIVRDLRTRTTENVDFKTQSYEPYLPEWTDNVQMALSGLGAERSLGVLLSNYNLHFLMKGARKADWDEASEEYSGPKRQQSPLIYGWYDAGSPPIRPAEWRPSFVYYDDIPSKWQIQRGVQPGPRGFKHRLGNQYRRTPVWIREGPGVEEWVMDILDEETVRGQFRVIGPFDRPSRLMDDVIPAIVDHEHEVVEKLYQVQDGANPKHVFPQSWDCYRFKTACPFLAICKNPESVGDDPVASGLYVPRRPHHQLEMEQMQARGLEIPEDIADPEEEE
jgi:PD-(D/E)XK nuclease superfamily